MEKDLRAKLIGAEPEIRVYIGDSYKILSIAEIKQFIYILVHKYPELVKDAQVFKFTEEQMRGIPQGTPQR